MHLGGGRYIPALNLDSGCGRGCGWAGAGSARGVGGNVVTTPRQLLMRSVRILLECILVLFCHNFIVPKILQEWCKMELHVQDK